MATAPCPPLQGGDWGGRGVGAGHDVPQCMAVKRPRSRFHDKKSLPCKGRWRVSAGGVGAGHDVRPCMGVKRPRSRFHNKKSLPCKGRWRVSAGGVGAGHDVPQCIVYKNAPCCKQTLLLTTHAPAKFTHAVNPSAACRRHLPLQGRLRSLGVGVGHDVPQCMDVKRPRSRFHDKKSLPCKGRWRDSAGGVGAGHDVRPCIF